MFMTPGSRGGRGARRVGALRGQLQTSLPNRTSTSAFAFGNWGGRWVQIVADGYLTGVVGNVFSAAATAVVRAAVYADSSMSVGALLAKGPVFTGVAAGVISLPLDAPLKVRAGQVVWVGWVVTVANVTMRVPQNTTEGAYFASATITPPASGSGVTYNGSSALSFWAEAG